MDFFKHVSSGRLEILSEYLDVDVTVTIKGYTYAGVIDFKREKCILKVYSFGDKWIDFQEYSECVFCEKSNGKTIILFDVRLVRSSSRKVPSGSINNEDSSFYELIVSFDFAYVGHGYHEDNLGDILIHGFELKFPKLINLIGDTITQGRLLHDPKTDLSVAENLYEFYQELSDLGEISVHYDYSHNNSNITSNKTLHPKISIIFNDDIPLSNLKKEVFRLYEIIAFFMGGDFDIEHIKVNRRHSSSLSQDDSIYFSSGKIKKNNDSPLLPFGINQSLWSPFIELPTDLFNKYYQLSDDDLSVFEKYTRYKRLNTSEDRFLGFFRLLEKLTLFKKYYVSEESLEHLLDKSKEYLKKRLDGKSKDIGKFISRIKKLNGSKNITETCLREFYKNIPNEIKKNLNIEDPDFTAICKLRNDITHANFYVIDDAKLFMYERFIHSLLFLSLLKKLDVSAEVCLPVMGKLRYF